VDPKKTPSSREYQLLAILVRNEWTAGKGAELNGRQIARAYEDLADESIPYGTVYTLLAAMEGAGWVRSREDVHQGRRTRWYRINRRGLDAVDRWRTRSAGLLALTTPADAGRSRGTRRSRNRTSTADALRIPS
jgi:DNA-binding PadR family transcriptional regulator